MHRLCHWLGGRCLHGYDPTVKSVTAQCPWQVLPLAGAFVGYIVLWNICLRVNSVVFYQLSKIMITPGVVILQAILFRMVRSFGTQKYRLDCTAATGHQCSTTSTACQSQGLAPALVALSCSEAAVPAVQHSVAAATVAAPPCTSAKQAGLQVPSKAELAAVAVLCVGVGLATVSGGELDANTIGVGIAVAAILVTSIYQVCTCQAALQIPTTSLLGSAASRCPFRLCCRCQRSRRHDDRLTV